MWDYRISWRFEKNVKNAFKLIEINMYVINSK